MPIMIDAQSRRGFWDPVGEFRREPEPVVGAAPYGGPERRDTPRVRTLLAGKIISGDGFLSPDCTVIDLSSNGARVRISGGVTLPPPAGLLLVREGLLFDAAIAWRRGDETGLVFTGVHDLQLGDPPERRGLQALWEIWSRVQRG